MLKYIEQTPCSLMSLPQPLWDCLIAQIRYDNNILMEDLQIAYYLGVIMVGLAALAIASFWAFKTKETDLRNFCFLYAAFTLVLILSVLRKYLFLNVEGYSPQAWYIISGIALLVDSIVIITFIYFVVGIYQAPFGRFVSAFFLITMLVSVGLIFSPLGATLDVDRKIIHFGIGMKVSSTWYFVSFTIAILIGIGSLRRVWNTNRRNFILGLMLFATVGYIETLLNFRETLQINEVIFGEQGGFLYSSIPYALYGIFLINHFLHLSPPTPIELGTVSESFLLTHGITDREREIILKLIEGKSNAVIARELFISLATVKTHLHNIYKKLGVESRFDLLAKVRSAQ